MPDPITPGRAARILAAAAAIDNRDPSAAADEMWARALTAAGVGYDDCMAAVPLHYARSTDRMLPGHIIVIARELAAERRAAAVNRAAIEGPAARPGVLDPKFVVSQIRGAVDAALARQRDRDAAAAAEQDAREAGL